RAGADAAQRADGMPMPQEAPSSRVRDEEGWIASLLQRGPESGRRVSEIKEELGVSMNRWCAVFRDEEGLTQCLEVVRRLQEEAKSAYVDDRGTIFNQDVLGAIELGYMLDCAEATVLASLDRKESRGAQFRTDFPERNDDEWLKHITVSAGADGRPEIDYAPVTITQWQPEERKY
ncbi:MAG TPA: succinate dehydrogenase/fumarate reductase flavoprotein subunit, partial [Solirubrobacteraceae bacterium]|nr:succinate dehydrogenase/fumarate reductase flavoprotein subunit [Solirubrobacteraceae bacterium]